MICAIKEGLVIILIIIVIITLQEIQEKRLCALIRKTVTQQSKILQHFTFFNAATPITRPSSYGRDLTAALTGHKVTGTSTVQGITGGRGSAFKAALTS